MANGEAPRSPVRGFLIRMAELSVAFSPPSLRLRRALLAIHPRLSGQDIPAKESESLILIRKSPIGTGITYFAPVLYIIKLYRIRGFKPRVRPKGRAAASPPLWSNGPRLHGGIPIGFVPASKAGFTLNQ